MTTYQSSGVNIDEGNKAVSLIKDAVKKTHNASVLSPIGGFAGFYELPKGYDEPVLVSCTDGVGTKVKLAVETGILDTVGIDLVAMCVNDLLCCGAKPLYFLDYIACHQLVAENMEQIINGIVKGCLESDCALIGGEMAEMNTVYQPKEFDLAGFSVGVVEKSKIIDGSKISANDKVYAFPSSGVHSNGFSLVRKILDEHDHDNQLSLKELLTPTVIYTKKIQALLNENIPIHGIAHITGGGLAENIERILPEHARVVIQRKKISILPIFKQLQEIGQISYSEMWRVFNMGVGMVVISPVALPSNTGATLIGHVFSGKKGVLIQ